MSYLEDTQQQILEEYTQYILFKNKELNLTTIRSLEEARLLHIEDSLVGLEEVARAPEGAFVDLGSGGGFPGVPLAVATGRPTTLVDATHKKMLAVQDAIVQAGIKNVSARTARIEDFAREFPGAYQVATARALTTLPSLLELAAPLLSVGGILVAYKSVHVDEEVERALSLEEKLAMKHLSTRFVTLSDGLTRRAIVSFRKTGEPVVSLPRRVGVAQKRPYA